MNVLTGRAAAAVKILAPLAAGARDATLWNDLAAARYTAAVESQHPEELVQALAEIDGALRIDPQLPEALFNRALIVERLAIREPAIAAWRRFIEVDPGSEWAVEARGRLSSLAVVEPDFRSLFDRNYGRLADDVEMTRDLTRRFRQEARVAAEIEILGQWGGAVQSGNLAAADRHLAVARAIGEELARTGGELIVSRAVHVIERSYATSSAALAQGHAQYWLAEKTFRSGRGGEAEPIFRRAAANLSAAGSPIALPARFFAAYMLYEQGKVQESNRELQELLRDVPSEFPTSRARVQWQLAIGRGAEGRWGEAIAHAQAAHDDFLRAGETYYAAIMREHLAEAHNMIGDSATAWEHRAVALREFGGTPTRYLQAVLGFLSQEAIFRRDWDQAATFTSLELEVAERARFQPLIADAHLRSSLILRRLGNDPTNEIARARIAISALPDPGMRSRLEARRMAIEAMVARTPSEAVPLLSEAIRFHAQGDGQRMFLPTLLLHRANTLQAMGQLAAARKDLDAALAELDAGRSSLAAAEMRIGIFESADAILDTAIDLALQQNDVRAAFAYSEHARARTLLDSLRSQSPSLARASVPAGTTIVEYAVSPSRTVIFVADSSSIRVAIRRIDGEELQRRIASFAESLSNGEANAQALGSTLYRDLIAPVQPWIQEKQTLVVVPDAATAALPFAALPTPSGGFLIEEHTLVASPSAAFYAQTASAPPRPAANQTALIVVNDATDAPGLDPIRSTNQEARRVASSYVDAEIVSGPAATRARFLQKAPLAGVIHFAGHALSSEYQPEETSIVLAGGDRLDATAIAGLDLSGGSVVVLAACSTARGKVRRYEGPLSVARGFLAAGAPTVVATLWPIPDDEAALFFPRLHSRIAAGHTPAEALRATQIESIRESRPPTLWAAVQVVGR